MQIRYVTHKCPHHHRSKLIALGTNPLYYFGHAPLTFLPVYWVIRWLATLKTRWKLKKVKKIPNAKGGREWLVTDEKERKMDSIHIRDVEGGKKQGGESVMNPSVSQSWTHKHQLSLLPIKPRRRPHTHREGCHVYRLKKLNRKKGDERNRTQFLRQS